MSSASEAEVSVLLREAEAAHGAYERDVLGGQRDADWASWYAAHLFDRGIGRLLPDLTDAGVAGLEAKLRQLDADFRREQPISDWPEFYGRRLIAAKP